MNPTDPASPSAPARPRLGLATADPTMLRVAAWALAAALVAGLLAWLVGETPYSQVRPSRIWLNTLGNLSLSTTKATELEALTKRSARVNGAFGALLGLAFGLAGALARGHLRSGAKAAILGLVLGAIAGAALPFLAVPLHDHLRRSSPDETLASILMHGSIWGAIGAVASLALAIGAGGHSRRLVACMVGGILGALIGTTIFDLLGGMALPLDETGEALSKSTTARMMAYLIVAVSVALGASTAFSEPRKRGGQPASIPSED
jgi:hypothetical protein